MKWLNGYRMRLVLIGVVAAIALSDGSSKAEIIMSEPICVDRVINNGTNTQECSFLHDGLKLYFTNNMPGGHGGHDIWVAERESQDSPWDEAVNLGPNVNSGTPCYPAISPDELELYFHTSWNSTVLMRSTRVSRDEPWGTPELFTGLGSNACDLEISADGLTVYFDSDRPGGYGNWDIWMATRETLNAPWGEPVNLGPKINDSRGQSSPSISNDELTIFYNNGGLHHISVATRPTKEDPWATPVLLGESVNNYGWVHGAEISPDGSALYFDSNRSGGFNGENFWQVSIIPIIDLNDDGIVDSADMCIIVDHWGTDEPLCDIGPMPWGDGIVDVQDLIVFAEHLFKEVEDPTLIAHWPLDEAQGDIAYDSAGICDGTLLGDPVWQPTGGMVDGAIQLDGVDDCVITGSISNPTEGPFSVFTWVKGGVPGQVVISQIDGASWLLADASDGKLMTELVPTAGRAVPKPLMSEFVVTDGNWHRIGLVWDGSHRKLYVDGVAVAEDEQNNLAVSENGLYISTDKAMEPGSFWFGLIDDVRIYNRALIP